MEELPPKSYLEGSTMATETIGDAGGLPPSDP